MSGKQTKYFWRCRADLNVLKQQRRLQTICSFCLTRWNNREGRMRWARTSRLLDSKGFFFREENLFASPSRSMCASVHFTLILCDSFSLWVYFVLCAAVGSCSGIQYSARKAETWDKGKLEDRRWAKGLSPPPYPPSPHCLAPSQENPALPASPPRGGYLSQRHHWL